MKREQKIHIEMRHLRSLKVKSNEMIKLSDVTLYGSGT